MTQPDTPHLTQQPDPQPFTTLINGIHDIQMSLSNLHSFLSDLRYPLTLEPIALNSNPILQDFENEICTHILAVSNLRDLLDSVSRICEIPCTVHKTDVSRT